MKSLTTALPLLVAFCLAAFLTTNVPAQHYAALPAGDCMDGHCIPNPANFGFYQTGWRRWPTSPPRRSVIDRRSSPAVENLPAVELPQPQFEGELTPTLPEPPSALPDVAPNDPLESSSDLLPQFDESLPTLPLESPSRQPRQTDSSQVLPAPPKFEVVARSADFREQPESAGVVPVAWENPIRSPDADAGQMVPAAESPQLPPLETPKMPKSDAESKTYANSKNYSEPRRIELPPLVSQLPPARRDTTEPSAAENVPPASISLRNWTNPVRASHVAPAAAAGDPSVTPTRRNPLRAATTAVPREGTEFVNPLRRGP